MKFNMNHLVFIAVLLGAVCILVNAEAYVDIHVTGCHNNDTDTENELQLDGEEMFYVDFQKKELVYTIPERFGTWNFPEWFTLALNNQQACLQSVTVCAEHDKFPSEKIDPPHSAIYSLEEVEMGKGNSLICFVTGFFPPPVKVKWTKNNVQVKDGVTLSRYYPNTDFTYQQFSTLSITPEEGDVYSCSVEHRGLQEPETKFWEPEANSGSDWGAPVFCGIGLTMGLVGVGVGTFFLIKGNNCN
ncbi:hypothetical protein GJAV_G00089280 [Gymnothorax javanicus]|nr:hypothetical protein GJAV_G00089280 [Gymnothorax javanicus]